MRIPRRALAYFLVIVSALSCNAGTKVFTMPTSSMEPTVREGEEFSADTTAFRPKRGDLIVFAHAGVLQLKRVIGIAEDTVEGRDLQIFVNGRLQQEPYVEHIGKRPLGMKTLETFSLVRIPEGELFVAGDNRDFSYDSRDPSFSLIPAGDVRGRLLQIVRSSDPKRIGLSPRWYQFRTVYPRR